MACPPAWALSAAVSPRSVVRARGQREARTGTCGEPGAGPAGGGAGDDRRIVDMHDLRRPSRSPWPPAPRHDLPDSDAGRPGARCHGGSSRASLLQCKWQQWPQQRNGDLGKRAPLDSLSRALRTTSDGCAPELLFRRPSPGPRWPALALETRGVIAAKEIRRAEATLSMENLGLALCAEHGFNGGPVRVTHGLARSSRRRWT